MRASGLDGMGHSVRRSVGLRPAKARVTETDNLVTMVTGEPPSASSRLMAKLLLSARFSAFGPVSVVLTYQ